MSDFSLRALAQEVAAVSNSTDPGALADEVFARIPRNEHGAALKETLRGYVRVLLAEGRAPEPFPRDSTNGGAAAGQAVPTRPNNRSWKRDGVREGWRARLRDRVHVGPGSTAWKFLGQCAFDDLMFMADERRNAAERTLARAAFYEGLAKLLKDHAVATVEELPEDVLVVHLGDEGGESE